MNKYKLALGFIVSTLASNYVFAESSNNAASNSNKDLESKNIVVNAALLKWTDRFGNQHKVPLSEKQASDSKYVNMLIDQSNGDLRSTIQYRN